MISIGCLVMASSIIPISIDDSIAGKRGCDIACMSTPWLAASGFTLIFSALFSKIWRLHKLFKNAMSFRRVEVSPKDVILPLVILMSLNFAFLAIWTVADPLYFERVDTGRTGDGDLSSYGRCTSDGQATTVMLSLILVVNFVAILLATFQAHQTRNLSTEFSESKYIALCMVSILQALLIGTPVLIIASTNPTANFIVRSMLVFVICMSVLGLLFLPKFFQQKEHTRSVGSNMMNDSSMYHSRITSSVQAFHRPGTVSSIRESAERGYKSDQSGCLADQDRSERSRYSHAPDPQAIIRAIKEQDPSRIDKSVLSFAEDSASSILPETPQQPSVSFRNADNDEPPMSIEIRTSNEADEEDKSWREDY
jgi:competence protein ComGC